LEKGEFFSLSSASELDGLESCCTGSCCGDTERCLQL